MFLVENNHEERAYLRKVLEAKYSIAAKTLNYISKIGGVTCDEFDECNHPWCKNSYKVWAAATKAIQDLKDLEDGVSEP